MTKKTGLRLTHKGTRWLATEATLKVDDLSEFGEYNHPTIWLTLVRLDGDGEPTDSGYGNRLTVSFKFQRNRAKTDTKEEGLASGLLDTAERWTTAYAGQVELDRASSFGISDSPFKLHDDDALRVKVARRVAKHISKRNLWHVHRDEAMRVKVALGELGLHVDSVYQVHRERYSLRQAPNRGANARWLAESADADRGAARPSSSATAATSRSPMERRTSAQARSSARTARRGTRRRWAACCPRIRSASGRYWSTSADRARSVKAGPRDPARAFNRKVTCRRETTCSRTSLRPQ